MATLATMLTRVRDGLMDSGSQVWTDGALTESIRLALGEYRLAGEVDVTLQGLDLAAATTLPAAHESLIVWGGLAYAALARAVDRAESFELGSESAELKAWGDKRLQEFKAMLGVVFPGYLVVLSGSSDGSTGADPAKTAAEIALLTAQTAAANGQATLLEMQAVESGAQAALAEEQAALVEAQTAHVEGEESRQAAAAAAANQARVDEAARLAELRGSTASPWGAWKDSDGLSTDF